MEAVQSNKIVSIIVVTCGAGGYLKRCLDSIKAQTYPDLEIIVIDNSLKPEFSRQIQQNYSNIRLHIFKENLFYCGGMNKGMRMSAGSFVLCLNDDVGLDKEFISRAVKGFDIEDKVGMVSGKVLRTDGKTIDSTGLFLSIFRTAKERGYGRQDRGKFDKPGYIFGVSGAAAFYRKKMLEDIKIGEDYFDPRFRMFYEDLDLAWRAQRRGWKGYYIPGAIAYHERGGSARGFLGVGRPLGRRYLSDDLYAGLIKNRYITILRNESLIGILLFLPFVMLYDMLIWGYTLLFRTGAARRFITKLKDIFQKRKRYKIGH